MDKLEKILAPSLTRRHFPFNINIVLETCFAALAMAVQGTCICRWGT